MTAKAEGIRVKPGLGPLASLYQQHSGSAFRLAYLLTGDAELAEQGGDTLAQNNLRQANATS